MEEIIWLEINGWYKKMNAPSEIVSSGCISVLLEPPLSLQITPDTEIAVVELYFRGKYSKGIPIFQYR